MTFLDLYGDQLDQELGSSDRTKLFTTAKRKAAVLAAELWFVKETACLQKTGSLTLVTDTATYSLETLITGGKFLSLAPQGPEIFITYASGQEMQIAGKDEFPRRTEAWLNNSDSGWRTSDAATPTCWYEAMAGAALNLGLYPAPLIVSGDTWLLKVPYVVKPDVMSLDADQPFTVDTIVKTTLTPWHRAIVMYAAHDLEKLRKDLNRSGAALAQATAEVLNYRSTQAIPQSAVIQPMRNYRRRHRSWCAGERFGRSPW